MSGTQAAPAASARILLDIPSLRPALSFSETASALAGIIEHSEARFSVGIFGGWGSGKTTLMNAIERALPSRDIIKVQFNAWRFEREPLLLVPLLDTIRGAIVDWSATAPGARKERARTAARRVGRVVRALAGGLSAGVGVAGTATISYDVGATVDRLMAPTDDGPQSLYVAAFAELREAFQDLSQKGARRIVVFVDDLDRCLPANALEVLEAMKLFFDLEGFVFVVGLDEDVVQRAVRARFRVDGDPVPTPSPEGLGTAADDRTAGQLERDYVEKIFQVPYRLPPMVDRQLGELLEAMFQEADLPSDQLVDLRSRIQNYLVFVAKNGRVNPREVKRFLNTYTLQTLIRPELDRDTTLALQTLLFRFEWRTLYDAILADSTRFIAALNQFRDERDEGAFEDLSPELAILPAELADFLTSEPAEALCRHQSLDAFLSSLEATGVTTPTWLTVAYREVGRLRSSVRRVLREGSQTDEVRHRLHAEVGDIVSRLRSLPIDAGFARSSAEPTASPIVDILGQMERTTSELAAAGVTDEASERLARQLLELADQLYRELRRFR